MKRYLVFAYDTYYPSGGQNDFVGDCDTLEEAQRKGKYANCDFVDILDTGTGDWL